VVGVKLEKILQEIQVKLRGRDEAKERVQNEMRRVLHLSKRAILLTHEGRLDEARSFLEDARGLLEGLGDVEYEELAHIGLVNSALQEYAEAHIFLGLVEGRGYAHPDEIKVPPIPYVLGLADVVGELRRRSLDLIRRGDFQGAEECLHLMEEIYLGLTGMEDAYLLVPGLRRKCDVARRIIEATRGDITIEARRASLEDAIRRLEKLLREAGGGVEPG